MALKSVFPTGAWVNRNRPAILRACVSFPHRRVGKPGDKMKFGKFKIDADVAFFLICAIAIVALAAIC